MYVILQVELYKHFERNRAFSVAKYNDYRVKTIHYTKSESISVTFTTFSYYIHTKQSFYNVHIYILIQHQTVYLSLHQSKPRCT